MTLLAPTLVACHVANPSRSSYSERPGTALW